MKEFQSSRLHLWQIKEVFQFSSISKVHLPNVNTSWIRALKMILLAFSETRYIVYSVSSWLHVQSISNMSALLQNNLYNVKGAHWDSNQINIFIQEPGIRNEESGIKSPAIMMVRCWESCSITQLHLKCADNFAKFGWVQHLSA